MIDEQSPIDPRDLELLRAAPPPDAALKARVRARLSAVIPSMALPSGDGDAPGPGRVERPLPSSSPASGHLPGTSPSRVGVPGPSAKLIAAFVAGGLVGAALHARLAKAPQPQVVYVDRSNPPSPPPAPSAPPSNPPDRTVAVDEPSAGPAPSRPAPAKSRASQLSAERMMLDAARAALARGEPQRALEGLERHRRTFPAPILAEERDALRVQALVKAARYDEARTSAEDFRRRFPESLFSSTVEAAIESIP